MDTGPCGGFTATTSVPALAARCAAWPIFSVIEAVVFGLITKRRMSEVPAEIGSLDTVIVHQVLGKAGQDDLTGGKRIGAVRDRKGHAAVLFHQKHRHSFITA